MVYINHALTGALTLFLSTGPASAQSQSDSIAFAGAEAVDAAGTRVWMTTLSHEPLLDDKELHATMKKALTGALELRIAKHGLTFKDGTEVQFRLADGSFESLVNDMAEDLTRISFGDASIVACHTGSGVFCPMPGEFYSHNILKSDLILLYISRGDDSRTAWLDASEAERAEFRAKVNQKLLELYAANAPKPDDGSSDIEEQSSVGDAALNLVYVLTLPHTAMRKLTPKALQEDIKEILEDPKGTLFGNGSKLDTNFSRIKEDFEKHWKSAFAGRGSSLDIVIHNAEETGEKIAKEIGRAGDSLKRHTRRILHRPVGPFKDLGGSAKKVYNKLRRRLPRF